jgi:uncharacterized cupin superfamily protein
MSQSQPIEAAPSRRAATPAGSAVQPSWIAGALSKLREPPPPVMQTMHAEGNELSLRPIDPAWIEEGHPIARCLTFAESPNKDLWSGLWECTAGKFRWVYWSDEIVQILEGDVVVREGGTGRVHRLAAGDAAYFPAGLVAHWEVPHYVRKFFVMRGPPNGPIDRLRRLLRAVVH